MSEVIKLETFEISLHFEFVVFYFYWLRYIPSALLGKGVDINIPEIHHFRDIL